MQPVQFTDLGQMNYQQAWDLQESLLQKNIAAKASVKNLHLLHQHIEKGEPTTTHHFLLVEHPPVYTLGKSGHIEHVLISEDERIKKNIEFFRTNRGGDITFHGPQQIVGYPILDLEKFYTDIGRYLRNLEEVVIQTMAEYGLKGERSKGETGVWLDSQIGGMERKICALGVRCSRWITMHGFAFNVNTDLSYFDHIIPCGIQNKQVTSLQKELGRPVDFIEVKEKVKRNFEKVFDVKLFDTSQPQEYPR
jgi:lipoyl(octanoyl) transferase